MSETIGKRTHVRYIVLGLVVLVYFITYLDRVLLSNALPSIQKEYGFSIETMGLVASCYCFGPMRFFRFPGAGSATASGRASRWPAWWSGGLSSLS